MNAAFSRLALTVGLLTLSSTTLTGCGSAPTAETSALAGITADAQSSAAETTAASVTPAGSVINGLPTKNELVNDGKGDYIQTTILPNDPALSYDPAVVEESATDLFSAADIGEAHKMIVTFIAEEVYDSTLNGNPGDHAAIDRWFAKHADIFASDQIESISNAMKTDARQHLVMRGTHRDGYELEYGPDQVHVLERDIRVSAIRGATMDGTNYLGFQATGSVTHAVRSKGSSMGENTIPDLNFTMKQIGDKWVIAGYQNTFNIAAVE